MANSKSIVMAVEFEVADKMVVADPCYIDTDDGSFDEMVANGILSRDGGVVIENAAGTWLGQIETVDEGMGVRVSSLTLKREGARATTAPQHVGNNGVDSGQMGAFCTTDLPVDYEGLLSLYYVGGEWVNKLILEANGGVVSSTGYGDGVYPVFVQYDRDGKPAIVTVEFLGDDDDEDEDYE